MGHESTCPSRRTVLKTTGAVGAASLAGLAGCIGSDDESIGNYPPEGDSVTIGFNGPLSGALGPDGQDQELGFDLAVQHLNEGGGLVDHFELSGNGILDYEVEATKADTEGDADTAQSNIESMIEGDNIQFWTGGMSSGVTIRMQSIAQEEKVPFMGGNSTSASISGADCSRYYFHPTFHAEIIGMIMGDYAVEELGEDLDLFHIYMDYSYGQTNRAAANKYLVEEGSWTEVGDAPIPEDEEDHSTQLDALEEADPDVLYFSSFGDLAANGLSQLRSRGLQEDIDVIIPHVSAFTLDPMGDAAEGVYGAEPWNPGADNEATDIFVQAYEDEYGETPNQSALHTYESMMVYAAAVEENGDFHPADVVRTLEGFSWSGAWGDSEFRECDHQVERPWYFVQGVGDDRADELGIRTEVVATTEPLVYECDSEPASECDMDSLEYGDE